MLTEIEERFAIEELIKLHGHVVDESQWERLGDIFTTDAVIDLSPFGRGKLRGLDAIIEAALKLGDKNPVAHHVTNILVQLQASEATAVSKGLG